jgi:endoribonuclease LACTB2
LSARAESGRVNIVTIAYHATNYYLIETDRARLLVDAGWAGTMPAFLHASKRMGVDVAGITHILVTHYHPDHAGLAQELKGRGAKLIVLETQHAAIPELNTQMQKLDAYTPIRLDDNIHLNSAESRAYLRGLGIAGEIVLTPGHSDDSVSLVLDTGDAFTGDLKSVRISDDPRHPANQSLARLRSLKVHTMHPAHGTPQPLRPKEQTR